LDGTGRNGIDREIDVATFVFSGTSERSGEVSETLDAKRAPRPPQFEVLIFEGKYCIIPSVNPKQERNSYEKRNLHNPGGGAENI
jgi:hypothetical protein